MPQSCSLFASDADARLVEVFDLLDKAIAVLDPDLCAILVNQRFRELIAPLGARPMPLRTLLAEAVHDIALPAPQDATVGVLPRLEAAMRAGPVNAASITLRNGTRLRLRAVRRGDQGWLLTLTEPAGPASPSQDDVAQLAVELRFNNETLESQAAYLASLAEAADANAQAAEEARRQLEREIAERRQLEQQLRQMATTDALTGAMNRGHFLTLGQREVSRVQALGLGLAVVMLDVDHFKAINDQHGHPAGDAALQHLVSLLRSGTRRVDLLGRMGGEEFALVLPAVGDDTAMEIAERLRALVARAPLTYDGKQIAMTISLGVASLSHDEATLETCLVRADAALYAAKHGGRNRVMRETLAVEAA